MGFDVRKICIALFLALLPVSGAADDRGEACLDSARALTPHSEEASPPAARPAFSLKSLFASVHHALKNDPAPGHSQLRDKILASAWTANDGQKAKLIELLDSVEILQVEPGGMGLTFRAREGDKTYRYKVPLSDPDWNDVIQRQFDREINFAIKAGDIGVGPKSVRLGESGALRMEEIAGTNLDRFHQEKLERMSERERVTSVLKHLLELNGLLRKLHGAGIGDMDFKPTNVMIGSHRDYLIDFGLSLAQAEFSNEGKGPYNGTARYQGSRSLLGRPGFSDDYESLRVVFAYVGRGAGESSVDFDQLAFLKDRPELRGILALYLEPVLTALPPDYDPDSESKLLDRALAPEMSEKQKRREFWNDFREGLHRRSPGQQLKILFSDHAFSRLAEPLSGLEKNDLKKLIDQGMEENHWRFNPEGSDRFDSVLRPIVEGSEEVYGSEKRDIVQYRGKMYFDRLKQLRMRLD